jgi:polar amino acid transport system substrate-binding protein
VSRLTRLTFLPRLFGLRPLLALLPFVLLAACAPRDPADGGPAPAPSSPKLDFSGQPVVFAVENGYVPFNFIRTDTRVAEGWDYDMAAELGRRLRFKPVFREIAWDSMIQGIATGQFDVAGNGITITPERARVVDFSDAYMTVAQRLLVRRDEARFTSLETFAAHASARIGAQKGNTNHTLAEKLVGPGRVAAFDGFGELVQALLASDIDAVLADDVGGQGYVGVHRDRLRLLDGGVPGQELGFIVRPGSPLRAAINHALAEMRADGTLARINAKWFAPDLVLPGAPTS